MLLNTVLNTVLITVLNTVLNTDYFGTNFKQIPPKICNFLFKRKGST